MKVFFYIFIKAGNLPSELTSVNGEPSENKYKRKKSKHNDTSLNNKELNFSNLENLKNEKNQNFKTEENEKNQNNLKKKNNSVGRSKEKMKKNLSSVSHEMNSIGN